jgi:hypothetical protein
MSQDNYRLNLKLKGGPVFLGLGILGAVGCAVSYMQNRTDFFASYLTAVAYFLALALGTLFFVMVQHLARAGWSTTVRRLAETVAGNLMWMPLFMLPLAFGLHELFPWLNPEMRAHDLLLQKKSTYLNISFFTVRQIFYLAVWWVLSWYFLRTSTKQDTSGDSSLTPIMGKVAAGGLALFALTETFWAFDWIMSLEPHWFSTMFGVYYFAGAIVGQYCVLILFTTIVRKASGRKDVYNMEHYHDMGKLLFGHNVFWTYIGFSQFFLIYYANIPEETIFFLHRAEGSWKVISLMLPWCHFAIPFLYLMSWHVKRNVYAVCVGAAWLLTMCYIDIYWLIQPNFHHHGAHFGLSDVSSILMVGGFFVFLIINRFKTYNFIPAGDPRLKECLTYDNGIVTHEHH